MALPAGVEQLGTFKGAKGNTGSLAFATAEKVAWTEEPAVEMVGPEDNRGAHFKVPMPLPGPETVNNDDATELLIKNPTKTSSALGAAYQGRDTLSILAPRATGSDQLVALTTAMASAATFGLTLVLNGDHVINGELLPLAGTKIEGRNGSITQNMNTRSVFRLENVTGVRITNVRAIGKTSDYANASSVYRSAAVYCTGTTSDVIVSGCTFLGFAGAGVYAAATCSDIHVDKTRMTGAGTDYITGTAFNFGAGVVIMDGCKNWSVRDCDISLGAQGIVTGHSADNFVITGNRIHDIIGQHGMYLRAVSGGIIQGNRVWNTVNQGIKIQITDTGPGVPSQVVSIVGNEFENIGVHAILISSTVALAVRRVMIAKNIIVGSIGGDGIVVDGAAITNITIADNDISGMNYGIRVVNGASRVWIHHNTIDTMQRTGISVSGGSYNTVESNQISNPGQASDVAANSGITLQSITDAFILFNRIVDTTAKMRYGIYLIAGTLASMDVIENVATGATDYGFRGVASDTARAFRGNRFAGTTGTITPANSPTNFIALSDATDAATTMARTNSLLAVGRLNGQVR